MKSKKNDADASGSGSSDEDAEYVVEKICSRRVRKGKVSLMKFISINNFQS